MYNQFVRAYNAAVKDGKFYLTPESAFALCKKGDDRWFDDETKEFERKNSNLVRRIRGVRAPNLAFSLPEEKDPDWESSETDSDDESILVLLEDSGEYTLLPPARSTPSSPSPASPSSPRCTPGRSNKAEPEGYTIASLLESLTSMSLLDKIRSHT